MHRMLPRVLERLSKNDPIDEQASAIEAMMESVGLMVDEGSDEASKSDEGLQALLEELQNTES